MMGISRTSPGPFCPIRRAAPGAQRQTVDADDPQPLARGDRA
jgi:hypothetical protein